MARGGRKYPLLVYRHLVGRWWTPFLAIGITLLLFVGILWGAEWYFIDPTQNPFIRLPEFEGLVLLIAGIISIGFSFFLMTMRNFAYVQLFNDHFRLVTPFLRLNISYKRIHRTNSSEMAALFPPQKLNNWTREMIGPLLPRTANVIHLTKYPVSKFWLKLFLSRFFFCDDTPHLVLILDDWMRFSTEIDSVRVSGRLPEQAKSSQTRKKRPAGLLDDLNRK